MHSRTDFARFLHLGLTVFFIVLLVGCAVQRPPWGDPNTGLILKYRMPENQVLKYRMSNRIDQNMQFQGQPMKIQMNTGTIVSLKSNGLKDKQYAVRLTLDSLHVQTVTPQGPMSPDVSALVGKQIDMSFSVLGKGRIVSNAESVKYSLGPGGERNLAYEFQNIFSVLPDKPVKLGDAWVVKDTMDIVQGNLKIRTITDNQNTFDGLESVQGMECIRVLSDVNGKVSGAGEQGGANLFIAGNVKSSASWYFAYKEGLFVKTTSSGVSESTVTIKGAQDMSIPMVLNIHEETVLIRKQ